MPVALKAVGPKFGISTSVVSGRPNPGAANVRFFQVVTKSGLAANGHWRESAREEIFIALSLAWAVCVADARCAPPLLRPREFRNASLKIASLPSPMTAYTPAKLEL